MSIVCQRSRSIMAALCLTGLIGLGMSSNAAQAITSAREPASCGHTSVFRDFLRPLNRMVPIQEPPTSGKLPFAPKGMSLETSGAGLVVGGGSVGFAIRDEAIQQLRHLNWIVETRLARVNAKGEIVSDLGVKRRRVGSIQGSRIDEFLHRVSGKPSFYRVDISFSRMGTHRTLGEYSAYARVMQPKVDLRVVAETPTVAPGELATAKLINLGTVPIESASYVFGFKVRRFDGSRWVFVAENPPRGPVLKRMQILPPGRENRGCLRYRVPDDAPAGRYRFQAGELVAEFEVTSSPLR